MTCLHLIDRNTAKLFGLIRYFTGELCPRGHLSERYVSGFGCIECAKADGLSEKRKAYGKLYYEKNKERIKSRIKNYVAENKDEVRASQAAAYAQKPWIRREQSRQWRLQNPELFKWQSVAYRANNPEKIAANKRKRKAAKKQRTVKWDNRLTDFVDFEAAHLCKLREKRFGFKWEIDHILPLLGKEISGLHVWNNLEVVPASFNLWKNAKFLYEEPFSWMIFI